MSAISIGLGLDTGPHSDSSNLATASNLVSSSGSVRSSSSMRGLQQAEYGGSMVELDTSNGTSGFKVGSRIVPESLSPSSLRSSNSTLTVHEWTPDKASLSRHGTLLTTNATPSRNASELKSVLGNTNARLKPGASIVPVGALSSAETTSLEQAKSRARVEVDVYPESSVIVQGGYLNGVVKIRIRERSRKESVVLISDGKLRLVGFECIQNEEKRHTFYQQSVLLSEASSAAEHIFNSPPDNEGFYHAEEGVHALPFSMYLPLDGGEGAPKGTIAPHNGTAVRYIVMISVKVKERETDRRSIAHFYRDCEVWPRLNPSAILTIAAQPVRESAAKSLFMGGKGKVGLTASLHRVHWVAGQNCCVKVRVINKSKKIIKSLTLALIRSTVTFKPNPSLDVDGSDMDHDADACQTSTAQKQVAESILEMGERAHARGFASSKGWWTGVRPDETTEFFHFLPLPSDALSISRARLIEVSYNIRVTISAGSLTSDIHVLLPIRIINFLSVDPPPSFPPPDKALLNFLGQKPPPDIADILEEDAYVSQTLNGRVLGSLSEDDGVDAEYADDCPSDTDDESMSERSLSHSSTAEGISTSGDQDDAHPRHLGNGHVSAHDDNEDFVQQAITSLKVDAKYGECGGRFADLYYSSMNEGLAQAADGCLDNPTEISIAETATPRPPAMESRLASPHSTTSSASSLANSTQSSPARLRGPSSFADRVQQKLHAKENQQRLQAITIEGSYDIKDLHLERESPIPEIPKRNPATPTAPTRESSIDRSKVIVPSSQGSTIIARQRSSTTGSYFRPRAEIPDEVERLDDEEVQDDDPPPRSPFAEISRKASELSVTTGGTELLAGSRVLPNPPSKSTEGLPSTSGSVLMKSAVDELLSPRPSTVVLDVARPTTTTSPSCVPSSPTASISSRPSRPGTTRARSRTLDASPPVHPKDITTSDDRPALKTSVGGKSVKDRIRQLEEKARAEKGSEDTGPL